MAKPTSQNNNMKQKCTSKSLKILMLSWEYPPHIVGGLSRHVYGLTVHIAEQVHEVHVLTAGNCSPSFEKRKGVNVHRIQPLNGKEQDFLTWIGGLNLAIAYKAEQLAKNTKFDIVHAHDWLVGASAIYIKESLEIPLLSTIHATEHGRNNGIHTELQRFIHEKENQLIRESDQIIVCSKYMKEKLISIFQEKDEKMVIISNGIEPLKIEYDYPKMFPELVQKKYIFSIGRIVKEKGFETIIEAASIAKERKMNIFFVIAGKGPLLDVYRRKISERDLEKYIAFIGFITEKQRNSLIHGCQMAVFPSLYEPFGIVALETMMQGKPTIVSNTGGLKGIVNHLQTGLLMTPSDPNSLLEQVEYLLMNPDKATEIGTRSKQLVKRMYGWKRIASETIRVIEDTLLIRVMNRNENMELVNKILQ